MDLDSDGDDAAQHAESCQEACQEFQSLIAALDVRPQKPSLVVRNIAALRTYTRCVRQRQPKGFTWGTLYEKLGFQRSLAPFTKHVDALVASKARDLLNQVDDWAKIERGQCRS
eukprot:10439624-Karenia_brevis.AAC.1